MSSSPASARSPPSAAATPPRLLLLLLTLLLCSPLDVAVAEELTFNIYVPYSIAAWIQRACPSSREAKGCGDVARVLCYFDELFFSVADLARAFGLVDHTYVDDKASMNNNTRWTLVARLAAEADSLPLRFSSGGAPHTSSQMMYEVAQRTTNLNLIKYQLKYQFQLDKPFDILPPAPARPRPSLEPTEPSPSPPLPSKRAKTRQLISIRLCSVELFLVILSLLIWRQILKLSRILRGGNNPLDKDYVVVEDDLEKGTEPKWFSYSEVAIPTNNLSDEKKLCKGGFGSVYQRLLLVLTLVLSFSLDVTEAWYIENWPDCSTTNNYTKGSQYQSNLLTLFRDLPAHAMDNQGFYAGTAGEAPDKVFGLIMCYADHSWTDCNDCLTFAAERVQQACPFSREAMSCNDVCILRYSNESFFSVANLTSIWYTDGRDIIPTSDVASINDTRWKLLTRLAEEAASSPLRFSSGDVPYQGSHVMYGIAQCTRDLNASECMRCLSDHISVIPSSYLTAHTCATRGYSCYVSHQLGTPFDMLLPALAPPPSSLGPGAPSPSPLVPPPPPPKTRLLIGISLGSVALLLFVILIILLIQWRRSKLARILQADILLDDDDLDMEDDFGKGTGPKRFPYSELAIATDNFSDEKKLGEGGFGSVYRGFLGESKLDVAIKRVSKGSKQGKKEYISEVTIISRLRHRNLVQLIGWCHAGGELLLVYELMPNGSLDTHLHGTNNILPWKDRHEIVLGLGSGLLYLHQDWEQCVLHRDIKPSNIMLDASFNAKLGDFGLARLVNHGRGSYTTMLAGTMGYIDPECFSTGKASTESDVYSFGVVLLEIACGRQPVVAAEEDDIIHLVQWVWNLFESGKILEAVDARLNMAFDDREVECVIIVGMWCTHPDRSVRPSIKKAVRVLRFEAPLPILPPMMSVTTDKMTVFDSFVSASQLSGGR